MSPFAGYEMPIQYPAGVLAEHLHTRKAAGLFDVSHMGQALIEGGDHAAVAAFSNRSALPTFSISRQVASATPSCSTKLAALSMTLWSPGRPAQRAR